MKKCAKELFEELRLSRAEMEREYRIMKRAARSESAEESSRLASLRRKRSSMIIKRLSGEESLAERILMGIENPRERTLLRLRYLDGMSWRDIEAFFADTGCPLCERQLFRIHTAALGSAEKVRLKLEKDGDN